MARVSPVWSCAVLALLVPVCPAAGGEVRIYRNGWGVPHIYADTAAEAAYGLGYAQGEDRLEAVLKNYLTAVGRMAEVFGPDHLDDDFRQLLWGHERIARSRYAELDPEVRALVRHFVAGLVAYMREHPRAGPAWAFEPQPYHVLALGRTLTWQRLERQADREFRGEPKGAGRSNQWVVGPERSVEDAVILCIDSHQNWDDSDRWYEAHLHGGALHAFGFAHPGLPVFSVGHNDRLGWAAAPGGPDGADVYEIDLESPAASRYRYGDGWRPIQTDTLRIRATIDGKLKTHLRPMQRTHHGPILHRQGARAYAYRLALQDSAGQVEQLYRQMTARNLEEFTAALALAQTGPQRLMYGDVDGNTFYIRTGRVPVRPEVYRYDRPLPGNTPEAEWQGIHAQEDLVQIHNPPQGWMQDCGASPDLVMPYSPLIPGRYPDYIFNHTPGTESPRSTRARQLLSAHSRMTLQEAFDLALDTYVGRTEHWQRALTEAYASDRAALPGLSHAVGLLTGWNGRADREEVGITLYARWRQICRQKGRAINARHILSRQKLGDETRRSLLEALGQAAAELESRYGRLEVPWKEVHRLRRGTRTWGVSGSSGEGLEALRTLFTRPDRAVRYGVSGQSCTTVVLFRAPGRVESFSATPYGQSDDPASPHAWDQAEALFSQDRLKPNAYRSAGSPPPPALKLEHTLKSPDSGDPGPQPEHQPE